MPYLDSFCRILQTCDSFCTGDRNYAGNAGIITLKGHLAAIKICSRQPPPMTTSVPSPIIIDLD